MRTRAFKILCISKNYWMFNCKISFSLEHFRERLMAADYNNFLSKYVQGDKVAMFTSKLSGIDKKDTWSHTESLQVSQYIYCLFHFNYISTYSKTGIVGSKSTFPTKNFPGSRGGRVVASLFSDIAEKNQLTVQIFVFARISRTVFKSYMVFIFMSQFYNSLFFTFKSTV